MFVLGFVNLLIVIYSRFMLGILFGFISVRFWFIVAFYFPLKNFFADKFFFNQ